MVRLGPWCGKRLLKTTVFLRCELESPTDRVRALRDTLGDLRLVSSFADLFFSVRQHSGFLHRHGLCGSRCFSKLGNTYLSHVATSMHIFVDDRFHPDMRVISRGSNDQRPCAPLPAGDAQNQCSKHCCVRCCRGVCAYFLNI